MKTDPSLSFGVEIGVSALKFQSSVFKRNFQNKCVRFSTELYLYGASLGSRTLSTPLELAIILLRADTTCTNLGASRPSLRVEHWICIREVDS